jgi:tryptophan halogenase
MMGQGVTPRAYHPIAGKLRPEELDNFLRMLRDGVARTLAGLPEHQAYIARYCAARPTEKTS